MVASLFEQKFPVHSVDHYHWVKVSIHSKHIVLMWSQYGGLLELQSLKDFLPSDLLWEYQIELVAVELSFIVFTSQLGYHAGVFQALFRSIVLAHLFWISWSEISIKLRIFFLDYVNILIATIDIYHHLNIFHLYFHMANSFKLIWVFPINTILIFSKYHVYLVCIIMHPQYFKDGISINRMEIICPKQINP